MADGETGINTINELKIWLEGEFKLIRSTQSTNAEELRTLRRTVHETNNHVSALLALNIPEKLDTLKNEVKAHDGVIEKLAMDQTALKTTMRAAYVAIGVAGAVFGAIATMVLRLYEVFGPAAG
jgi:hypothetical protein